MSSVPVGELFAAGLLVYAVGAAASLVLRRPAVYWFAIVGGLLEGLSAVLALAGGQTIRWAIPSGVPLFSYSFSHDPLSAYFNLALSILTVSASVYSLGYTRHLKNQAIFGFFFHLLPLSLALVFSADNAFFFLIAWEVMALVSYCLVSFEHQDDSTRHAGLLYFVMSHIGAGCLLLGFVLLAQAAGSGDFTSLHGIGSKLGGTQAAAFLLFFIGFGIKAGIIPLHIWLPAAHPVAPSNISALMSGIVIKAGIYGMARVLFEFLGTPPLWAGVLVLAIGVISALLGVLYALMEHDLKRLLAYHSIENIGIILIGFGASMTFRVFGHPHLAALALIAGLYHTLNHAIFKCLLFLGAGSVLHATGTRNMEEMGGLIRPMPRTSLFFLVGAVAISGLPPLNGFVSEWITYQALLSGFGSTHDLTRVIFPIAGSLLALTSALAAACFVKAFGITFLALPRSEKAEGAKEAPLSMTAGMGILAAACFVLGLGATWFIPTFDGITAQLVGGTISSTLVGGNGWVLSAGSMRGGTVSTAGIAAMLVILSALPGLMWLVWGRKGTRSRNAAWDCGQPGLTAEHEYTATAFSKPLRMIFATLYKPKREIQTVFDVSPYYPTEIRFESEIEPTFEKRVYNPVQAWILEQAGKMRGIQAGSIHAYLAYIFVTLIVLLLFGVRA